MSDKERRDLECRVNYGKPFADVVPRLAAFRQHRDEHRRNFEESGSAMTQDEAKKLFEIFPRIAPENSKGLCVAGLVEECFTDGRINDFTYEVVSTWLDPGFDRWDRLLAQRALDVIAAIDPPGLSIVGRTHDGREAERPLRFLLNDPSNRVKRPPGQYDPGANMLRDTAIVYVLSELQGCGLPVTSRDGESLAGALAKAWGIHKSTIANVWRDAEPRQAGKQRRSRRCARCGTVAGEGASSNEEGDLICRQCQRTKVGINA